MQFSAVVHVPPLPVTVNPPLAPVLLRTIPFDPPLAEMLRNVRPAAPIVVLETLSAVPVVVVRELTIDVLFCVAVTVPPPVAAKAALVPVERRRPPVKAIVPLSLLSRLTPVPPPVTEPVNWTRPGVPVLRLVTSMVRPPDAELLIVPA